MRTTDRLTLALLKQRIIQARAQLREACRLVNYDQAVVAEREMNARLDELAIRLGIIAS